MNSESISPTNQPSGAGWYAMLTLTSTDHPPTDGAAGCDVQPAVDQLLAVGFSFRHAKLLLSAVEFDLFTTLAGGPLGCEAISELVGLHHRGARDFLDALAALGLLS